jgi:hypothetical protein
VLVLDGLALRVAGAESYREKTMLSLFTTIDGISMLQIQLLVFAVAILCTVILSARCPICSWFEWISPSSGDDEPDE